MHRRRAGRAGPPSVPLEIRYAVYVTASVKDTELVPETSQVYLPPGNDEEKRNTLDPEPDASTVPSADRIRSWRFGGDPPPPPLPLFPLPPPPLEENVRAFVSVPVPIVRPNAFTGRLLETEPENMAVCTVVGGATLGEGVGEGVVPPPLVPEPPLRNTLVATFQWVSRYEPTAGVVLK
jgi:hypothetical protein